MYMYKLYIVQLHGVKSVQGTSELERTLSQYYGLLQWPLSLPTFPLLGNFRKDQNTQNLDSFILKFVFNSNSDKGGGQGNLKGGMELLGVNYQLELGCSCRSRCAGSRLGRWGFTKQKKNKIDRAICHLHIVRSIKKGELLIKTLSVKLTCQRFFFLTLLKCVDSLLNNYYTTTIAPTLFQSFLLHSLMGCRQFSDKDNFR